MKRGLRLEWLIAFGALLVLSFIPLYFAVSRLTEASLLGVRERSARELGRAIAAHVGSSASAHDPARVGALLDAQVDGRGVIGVALYDEAGERVASSGSELEAIPEAIEPREVARVLGQSPRVRLLVVMPGAGADHLGAAVLLSIDSSTGPLGPLVRLIALYTGVVALALLVFGYFLMTRLVVRPLEDLSRAARRVAEGGRTLELRPTKTLELAELGESLATMTERLRAEEESLRAKVDELETATRELKSAQETLVRSERLASVGRLAAGLAHEIGNPIAAILGFEELLIEGGLPPDEAHDFLVRMKRETERVNSVLRDLLDFARARRPRTDGAVEPGNVRAAVASVVTLIAPQRGLKGVALEQHVEDGLPPVGLSEEHLTQILLNLLLNAGDAVPENGGEIDVRAERSKSGGVAIFIDDNGPGIAKEIAGTLFEPFATTKDVGKGTGLGLSVCKGLVESVGGTITAEESPLGGARFAIELPAFGPDSKR
ncbi:MAG: ATP-binding protein [Polyangiaceae bacterium]